jgi:hypothetical protein
MASLHLSQYVYLNDDFFMFIIVYAIVKKNPWFSWIWKLYLLFVCYHNSHISYKFLQVCCIWLFPKTPKDFLYFQRNILRFCSDNLLTNRKVNKYTHTELWIVSFSFLLTILGFELRASHLQGRHSYCLGHYTSPKIQDRCSTTSVMQDSNVNCFKEKIHVIVHLIKCALVMMQSLMPLSNHSTPFPHSLTFLQ